MGAKSGELLAIDYARSNSLVRLDVLAAPCAKAYYDPTKFLAPMLCDERAGSHTQVGLELLGIDGRCRTSTSIAGRRGHRSRRKDCHLDRCFLVVLPRYQPRYRAADEHR